MAKKLTTAEFIKRARCIHGDKYDYRFVNYVNAHTKIVVVCPLHGEFVQEPTNHVHNCFVNRESNYQQKGMVLA